jgi:hypothetical protein
MLEAPLRLVRYGLLIGLSGVVVGCGDAIVACSSEVAPGIEVTIIDARDGTPLAGTARGSVRDGEYLDSLRSDFAQPSLRRFAADDRPGTYPVEVVHPGRQVWTQAGVEVELNPEDPCYVKTVGLHAELEPLP